MKTSFCFLANTACIITSILLVSCTGSNDDFFEKMSQRMKPVRTMTEGYRVLDLNSLTDFEWDTVYFFKGGSLADMDIKDINMTIGFEWNGPPIGSEVRRLLFVRGREVVSYTDFMPDGGGVGQPMPIWMFGCKGDKGSGISRKDARFAVFRNCAASGDFQMVPLKCVEDSRIVIEQGCTEKTLELLKHPFLYDSTGRIIPVMEDSTGMLVPIKN
ncbi:hypothetical protein MUN81_07705 [Hymenobacter sp. 5317J-9]|uniref:hypothetical protein n=1 Tax=Hymenobacter sp. 5317J-9 TaxID=2932250 RepID=UPI001FD6396F|nr:hypothetical protein [Hymenobacter sp. 5317J-9]UOQ99374.1 hypothetical protein MUN81_07705 [Hymenobacter sp. 5317J-9]